MAYETKGNLNWCSGYKAEQSGPRALSTAASLYSEPTSIREQWKDKHKPMTGGLFREEQALHQVLRKVVSVSQSSPQGVAATNCTKSKTIWETKMKFRLLN